MYPSMCKKLQNNAHNKNPLYISTNGLHKTNHGLNSDFFQTLMTINLCIKEVYAL